MKTLVRSCVALALAAAAPALASKEYPADMQAALSACATPPCTICHSTAKGGAGTATKPFAITMQNAGLTGSSNAASLQSALQTVEQQGSDSDGDGVTDVAELAQGSDPSNPSSKTSMCSVDGGGGGGGGSGCGQGRPCTDPNAILPPTYGCFGTPAAATLLFAGVLALAFRPRARR